MTTVGGFRLDRRIGFGAMGEVWRASAADGTPVAVKVARTELRENPLLLKLMDGEVRALARLDHPRVAWLYDHGRIDDEEGRFPLGCPYLVLEYCGGGTLADRPLGSWEEVREVLVGLLQALAHAHPTGSSTATSSPRTCCGLAPRICAPG
jgi:serine/threonine-protein kinase